jgi:hypothetical protein
MTIDESYKMTYDQVVNWDKVHDPPLDDYENSGIEGGVTESDYKLVPGELMGGRRKTRKTRKTRKRI